MSNQDSDGCITLSGLLGVVFVTLKLCGVIDGSWIWVTLPFWGGFAILVTMGLLVLIGFACVYASCVFAEFVNRRKR